MSKYLLAFVAFAVLCGVGVDTQRADAQGVHFQTRRLHVDVGQPHGYYGWGGNYWGGGYGRAYGGGYYSGGHADWHDTTHLDYHPGGYVPHYGHFDYVPGHHDVHHSGHWDSHW